MMASSQQSYFFSQQQQQPVYTNSPVDQTAAFGLSSSHVSPSILLIIVILAVVFFVSGLLHLLVRFLLRPTSNSRRREALTDRDGAATALQGQLRQLFHLHDAGVDQTFIDALPVFLYKAVIGAAKSYHLDCAVCLCEFEPEDRLRLLPLCSHAFHVDCIDTWLLSHSTCPLCRASLLVPSSGVSIRRSPLLLVLESAAVAVESDSAPTTVGRGESVVTVKLGKFKTTASTATTSTSSDIGVDSRRCFSMGSFAYVVDESSEFRVPIRTPAKKSSESKKVAKPVFRMAISECDCESKRDFEFGDIQTAKPKPTETKEIGRSRRAFSFRFFRSHESVDQDQTVKGKLAAERFPRRTVSEIGVGRRENGNEVRFGGEEESGQIFNSLDLQSNTPSFARKTLLWLMGRQQNKVGDSSLDPPDNNV